MIMIRNKVKIVLWRRLVRTTCSSQACRTLIREKRGRGEGKQEGIKVGHKK